MEDSWYGIDKGVTMAELRNSMFEIRLVVLHLYVNKGHFL